MILNVEIERLADGFAGRAVSGIAGYGRYGSILLFVVLSGAGDGAPGLILGQAFLASCFRLLALGSPVSTSWVTYLALHGTGP